MANLPPPSGPISQPPALGLAGLAQQLQAGLITSRQTRSTFKAASPSIYYAITPQLPRYMSYENLGSKRLNYGDAAIDNVSTSLANPQNKKFDIALPLVSQDGTMGVSFQRPVLASCSGSSALLNLPTEILLQIIHQLSEVFSTCLGLTCKELYSIHRNRHGSVPLTRFARHEKSNLQLGSLLSIWAGSDFIYFKGPPGLFISKERHASFLAETHEQQRRQDLTVQRLVEIDLINWEAKILRDNWLSFRYWPEQQTELLARKLRPMEWQCERAATSGFNVSWLSKTTDLGAGSLCWTQYDGFMGLGFGR